MKFECNICNQADALLFKKQCHALETHIPGLQLCHDLENVDGSVMRIYSYGKGTGEGERRCSGRCLVCNIRF